MGVYKYFWILDNKVGRENIEGYYQAIHGKRNILESKLAYSIEMLRAEIPVPPQIYLTPRFAKYARMEKLPKDFLDEFSYILEYVENRLKMKYGAKENPLLFTIKNEFCGSIRNIGVTTENLPWMTHYYGNEQAYNHFIGLLETYSNLVLNCPFIDFKAAFGIKVNRETGAAEGLGEIPVDTFIKHVEEYLVQVSNSVKRPFPTSPEKLLLTSLLYIARSCRLGAGDEIFIRTQIPLSRFNQATTGLAYTRNPFTGSNKLYGRYICGQDNIKASLEPEGNGTDALANKFPGIYSTLRRYLPKIEKVFANIIEAEFITSEDGELVFTNFSKADTLARATIQGAISLNTEGIISDEEALRRIKSDDLDLLLHPTLDERCKDRLTDLGVNAITAAPGTVVGNVFFNMKDVMEHYQQTIAKKEKARIILIADELLVSDAPILGIICGLVTKSSGMASHAAVMARSNGIPCIIGCHGLAVSKDGEFIELNGRKIEKGSLITMEAAAQGRMYLGEGKISQLSHSDGVIKDVTILISRFLKSKGNPVNVMVNINNHEDASIGLSFGADGVGLCRTENMLTQPESIRALRKIIYSDNSEITTTAFEALEKLQQNDFIKIFRVLEGKEIKIRLMDMPLGELIPTKDKEIAEVAGDINEEPKKVIALAEKFKESNPMLGLRACRFGIMTPEVYDMQIRAIVSAAYLISKDGINSSPGIMFPLVLKKKELVLMRNRVLAIEEEIRQKLSIPFEQRIHFQVGTMLELPATALSADRLATISEFFSFGTNDLTQTTLGISRNDCENYLSLYIERGIFQADPFNRLDDNVKELIEIAVSRARRVRKGVAFGICGEQGGDIETLSFALLNKLNYVSCSAFRILPTKLNLVHLLLDKNNR